MANLALNCRTQFIYLMVSAFLSRSFKVMPYFIYTWMSSDPFYLFYLSDPSLFFSQTVTNLHPRSQETSIYSDSFFYF